MTSEPATRRLSYLQLFPFDFVKIDRPFVNRTGSDQANTGMMAAMVQMAGSLNLTAIAEIIETEAAAKALQEMGCEYGQGYYFSEPIEAELALQRLRTQEPFRPPQETSSSAEVRALEQARPPEKDGSPTGTVRPPAKDSSPTGTVRPPAKDSSPTGMVRPPEKDSSPTIRVPPLEKDSSPTTRVPPLEKDSSPTTRVRPLERDGSPTTALRPLEKDSSPTTMLPPLKRSPRPAQPTSATVKARPLEEDSSPTIMMPAGSVGDSSDEESQ